jgi:hypothetical protein
MAKKSVIKPYPQWTVKEKAMGLSSCAALIAVLRYILDGAEHGQKSIRLISTATKGPVSAAEQKAVLSGVGSVLDLAQELVNATMENEGVFAKTSIGEYKETVETTIGLGPAFLEASLLKVLPEIEKELRARGVDVDTLFNEAVNEARATKDDEGWKSWT